MEGVFAGLVVLRGDGEGRLEVVSRTMPESNASQLDAADLDGDGDLDLAGGAGEMVIFTNCGTP